MTIAQELFGSLGLASLRVNRRMSDYASAAARGPMLSGGPKNPLSQTGATSMLINEVGITDSVMAELWHGAPAGFAFGVSTGAETNHVGADLAIMDQSSQRILLYQAKIARLDVSTSSLIFKSESGSPQVEKLQKQTVTVGSVPYDVTGRYCLYQSPQPSLPRRISKLLWAYWGWPMRLPEMPQVYFDEVLRTHGVSPRGILAAGVPPKDPAKLEPDPVKSMPLNHCWPWEYDVALWLHLGSLKKAGSSLPSGAMSMSGKDGSESPFGPNGESPIFGPEGLFEELDSSIEISDDGGDSASLQAAEIAEQLGLAGDETLNLLKV